MSEGWDQVRIKKAGLVLYLWHDFKTGIFYESYKYVNNFDLPLQFVVEDNNLSTNTPTDETWGGIKRVVPDDIIYYSYKRGYLHHGTGNWILF